MRLRRLHSRSECDDALDAMEPLEPRTTMVVAALLLGPSRGRRIYVVEDGDRLLGVLSVERLAVGQWKANATVLDPAAARPLAEVLDRSPARLVGGPIEDIEPLAGFARRAMLLSTIP